MKRILIACALLLCMLPTIGTVSAADDPGIVKAKSSIYCFFRGDVNGDGDITPGDARLILRCTLGLDPEDTTRSLSYEVDGTPGITPADARECLRISLKLSPYLRHVDRGEELLLAATCAHVGYKGRRCVNCGECYSLTTIRQEEHDGVWKTVKEATCSAPGEREYRCLVCDELLDSEPIPQKSHIFGPMQYVREDHDCEKFQEMYKECVKCKERVYSIREPSEHVFELQVTLQPTCTEYGLREQVCKVCGHKGEGYTVIPATGHDATGPWIVAISPTRTEDGLRILKCLTCGEILKQEPIPKTGN
jgi:hypothetical protein